MTAAKQLKKITISQAARALNTLGYKLGRSHTDLSSGITSYQVAFDDSVATMTTDEIKGLVIRAGINTR